LEYIDPHHLVNGCAELFIAEQFSATLI